MVPRKRRDGGRVTGFTTPPTSTHVVNTRGFATLPDEIYLEIVSHIPSVPIPTPESIHLESYPEIRRSRHETFLSLTQTSRSLRRFFWRYLWQRIEVREGMKIGGKDDTLKDSRSPTSCTKYATELVRQLEIVTIRNPLLAQYVNYLDIFIGDHLAKTVLAELARCLSLFENLHTVQIDVNQAGGDSLEKMFKQTFEGFSYPQIRNVFTMCSSLSFVASCPQARRVGFIRNCFCSPTSLQRIVRYCPHLEELEDISDIFWTPFNCNLIVNNLPNLRTIQFTIYEVKDFNKDSVSLIDSVNKLNHLQTIVLWTPLNSRGKARMKEYWIELAKRVLIRIQLRDNLEKTIVVLDYDDNERRILLKPRSSLALDLEEGS